MMHTPAMDDPVLWHILETTMTVSGVFLALAVISTCVRFYVRAIMLRNIGWDDWLIFAAMGAFVCQSGILIYINWTIQYTDYTLITSLTKIMEFVVFEFACYLLTTILLKLSIAMFFLRIVLQNWQRWVVIVSTTIFSIFTLTLFFLAIFECGNPKFYLLRAFTGKCAAWSVMGPMNYTSGILNALTDWIFVALPILVIRKTRMRWNDKCTVVLVLMIGAMGSIASIVRLFYIETLHPKEPNATSFIHGSHKIAISSIVESGLGIVAACMATMRPLIRRSNSPNSTKHKVPTSAGALVTAQPRQPGEFAAYGVELDEKAEQKTKAMVMISDAQEKSCISSFDVESIPHRRGSATLIAELKAARQAYDDRSRNSRVGYCKLNCLLPDVEEV